jgi:hypothetical protein
MTQLLYPWGRAAGAYWIGGWVDPTAGMGNVDKILDLLLPDPRCSSISINLLCMVSHLAVTLLFHLVQNISDPVPCMRREV